MGTTNFDEVAASTFTGNIAGNLTGMLIGGVKDVPVVISGDGAITVTPSTIVLTKASAAAITIVAPTTGTHDGYQIWIYSETAQAHVITCSTDGFNSKGSSGTITFSTAKGNAVLLHARLGHWWVISNIGGTVA